jgi:hypothetical protein
MDPQAPPTAPSLATQQNHHSQTSAERLSRGAAHVDNEEDSSQQQYCARPERGSKGSNARGHDSVMSHPFSPKPSSPPSPTSSISSAGRKHRSISEIQEASHVSVSYPPRAYIDPEKGPSSPRSPRSNRVSSSNPNVTATVFDAGEYIEKDPGEKAVQLLVRESQMRGIDVH